MARLSSMPTSSGPYQAFSPATSTGTSLKRVDNTPSSTAENPQIPQEDVSFHPNGYRSLSFISIQAFALGNILSACILSTVWLALRGHSIWRLPAFFVCLSLFHFLEFYMTARFNAPAARASSFLLFNNGRAYTLAHTMAAVEILLTHLFWPSSRIFGFVWVNVLVGAVLIASGQAVRSAAMAQAGTNFNHIIARERKESHVLVTDGIYAVAGHPSYAGFFWWAVGTQLLVGNKFCLVGYAAVLWKFFSSRIQAEEQFLIKFFDEKYIEFKKRTPSGIPFVS